MPNAVPLSGLVVLLDDVDIDDLVGAVEVLVQEGFGAFSLPAGSEALTEFAGIYLARARIGVHGLTSPEHVAAAAGAGCTFAFFDAPDEDGIEAASDAGLAVYSQAMTPAEVRSTLRLPVTGAMLFPADVVGHLMASRLATLGLVGSVVPRGGLGAYAAGEWLKAGAPAACVDSILLSDALRGGDLQALRERCSSFIDSQRRAQPVETA